MANFILLINSFLFRDILFAPPSAMKGAAPELQSLFVSQHWHLDSACNSTVIESPSSTAIESVSIPFIAKVTWQFCGLFIFADTIPLPTASIPSGLM